MTKKKARIEKKERNIQLLQLQRKRENKDMGSEILEGIGSHQSILKISWGYPENIMEKS